MGMTAVPPPVINRLPPPSSPPLQGGFDTLGCPKQVRIQPRGQSSVLLLLSRHGIKPVSSSRCSFLKTHSTLMCSHSTAAPMFSISSVSASKLRVVRSSWEEATFWGNDCAGCISLACGWNASLDPRSLAASLLLQWDIAPLECWLGGHASPTSLHHFNSPTLSPLLRQPTALNSVWVMV